jgi:cytoskeletal protein CcmA (bactofilin family)
MMFIVAFLENLWNNTVSRFVMKFQVGVVAMRKKDAAPLQPPAEVNPETIYKRREATIVGRGISLEIVSLTGAGDIRVDGRLSGNINIDGNMFVGDTGAVAGIVKAESAQVAGNFEGNLTVVNGLHLMSTAALTGNVETGKIVVDEGAVFNATCVTHTDNKSEILYEIKKDTGNEISFGSFDTSS